MLHRSRSLRTLFTALVSVALIAGVAAAAPVEERVNPALVSMPAEPVGTLLLLHGGGWAGPDRSKQEALMAFPAGSSSTAGGGRSPPTTRRGRPGFSP
jgi:hypothetical protein